MSNPSFYHNEQDLYRPTYGDIDWRALRLARLAAQNVVEPTPVWFDSGDGLRQQCTQENTDIYMSQLNDDMDVVLVLDPRDKMKFSFFRDTLGEDFDRVSRLLQGAGAAAVHMTMYPHRKIAELWTNLRQGDLSRADFVPEEWA